MSSGILSDSGVQCVAQNGDCLGNGGTGRVRGAEVRRVGRSLVAQHVGLVDDHEGRSRRTRANPPNATIFDGQGSGTIQNED